MRGGAVWQLVGLITRRSQVQILPPLPKQEWVPLWDPFLFGGVGARRGTSFNKTRQRFGRRLVRRPGGVRIGLSRFESILPPLPNDKGSLLGAHLHLEISNVRTCEEAGSLAAAATHASRLATRATGARSAEGEILPGFPNLGGLRGRRAPAINPKADIQLPPIYPQSSMKYRVRQKSLLLLCLPKSKSI